MKQNDHDYRDYEIFKIHATFTWQDEENFRFSVSVSVVEELIGSTNNLNYCWEEFKSTMASQSNANDQFIYPN